MSKNYKILLLFLLPLISLFSGEVLSGGLYLINGVGLPGTLVIGQKASGKEGAWIVHSSDLKYKVNNKGLVVLIKCVGNKCIADHDITVGTSKGTLLRRYGLPDREQTLKTEGESETLFEYQGIGFGINNEGIIRAIYIFPVFEKK